MFWNRSATIALAIGWYYATIAAGNVRRLQDAARKVADGNFETTIPVASVGQLAPLARTFNEMQRRLAELDIARKQFIANASHELRTPIFSLGGFVELLDEEDPSPEERAKFVRTMRRQIERDPSRMGYRDRALGALAEGDPDPPLFAGVPRPAPDAAQPHASLAGFR